MKRILAALFIAVLSLTGCAGSSTPTAPSASKSPDVEVLPLGSDVSDGIHTLVVNSVDLDATDTILDFNALNDEPDEGIVYILVNITMTRVSEERGDESPSADIKYVATDGTKHRAYIPILFLPEEFNPNVEVLALDESTTGNVSMQAPADSPEQGMLEIRLPYSDGRTYVAVK